MHYESCRYGHETISLIDLNEKLTKRAISKSKNQMKHYLKAIQTGLSKFWTLCDWKSVATYEPLWIHIDHNFDQVHVK